MSGRPVGPVVGEKLGNALARLLSAAVLVGAIAGPLHGAALASDTAGPVGALAALRAEPVVDQAAEPAPKGFTDSAARVSFDPPIGWVRAPSTALNPQSDPPDPAQELVRYQLQLGDPRSTRSRSRSRARSSATPARSSPWASRARAAT